ncbi:MULTISPECIES: quinolinate synthase NadA [unclassified Fusibacter]|uniref:quinolinate synthase NadA n=1 Tax=unclassified Fusibacter TaxID=2624464 RepID=UPI001011137A|nr:MULTISPECIES: quinolinate synthase NadA [unclassified Fusibacter]MCK8059208.1 quinolinate synthase NadA [Fusibacter sp. A2]NPE21330.1 quinolinate synthase NadA [Fusibacter sp. A1]RXV62592.1 quinolinate synthase NadA [Fusibacter sp. A1]
MDQQQMINEIMRLKEERNAVILAHNYQVPEVQDIADIVGDSLKLSQEAADTTADVIVFCGVHFMAESAKILSPAKKVLLPVLDAGCPMADMITGEELRAFKAKHPGVPVVCYVNSSAEVKAECDVTCTSSNALNVVKSLNAKKVIFAPDRNLGSYIDSLLPEVEIINWDGFCITHERVNESEIIAVKEAMPDVKVLVHPECNPAVVQHADYTGSTAQIISYVKGSEDEAFIIGTEMGILHALKKQNPTKKFYMLSPSLICANMKKTSLKDVYLALKNDKHIIEVDEETRLLATEALSKMVATN